MMNLINKKIFNDFSVNSDDLDAIVTEINKRQTTSIISQIRQNPLITIHARTPGRSKKSKKMVLNVHLVVLKVVKIN